MTIPIYIYSLCEPDSTEYRYVGRTKNLDKRYKEHLAEAKVSYHCATAYKCLWLKSLLETGLKPALVLLEETNSDIAHQREAFWIKKLKGEGYNLTNFSMPNPNKKPVNIIFRNGVGTYW